MIDLMFRDLYAVSATYTHFLPRPLAFLEAERPPPLTAVGGGAFLLALVGTGAGGGLAAARLRPLAFGLDTGSGALFLGAALLGAAGAGCAGLLAKSPYASMPAADDRP